MRPFGTWGAHRDLIAQPHARKRMAVAAHCEKLTGTRSKEWNVKVWMWGVLAVLLLGGATTEARAQDVRVRTHVSADSVRVGERFTVSFTVEHAEDVQVLFPDPADGTDAFGDIEVMNRRERSRRPLDGGRRVDSVAYEVTTFALDSVRVPAIPIPVVVGGDTSLARTPPRGATVISVIGPESRGIHSVGPLASFPSPWWPWVLAGLLTTLLLAGLAYLWWRRQQPEEATSTVQPASEIDQTPYEAATAWIRQLDSYDLSDPAAVKPFYVELSSALRVYLAREWDVAALERTTREVIDALEARSDVPDDAIDRLESVLERADLVKFADVRPDADAHDAAIEDARAALDTLETTPPPTETNVDGVASAAE